jgi:hypothetical protein
MQSFRYCFVDRPGHLHGVKEFATGSESQAIAVARLAFADCGYPVLEVWHGGKLICKENRSALAAPFCEKDDEKQLVGGGR